MVGPLWTLQPRGSRPAGRWAAAAPRPLPPRPLETPRPRRGSAGRAPRALARPARAGLAPSTRLALTPGAAGQPRIGGPLQPYATT
eukprot:10592778-Lingulodinium_polyedra.AAC.1